jgi:hypothetical protein
MAITAKHYLRSHVVQGASTHRAAFRCRRGCSELRQTHVANLCIYKPIALEEYKSVHGLQVTVHDGWHLRVKVLQPNQDVLADVGKLSKGQYIM